MAIRMANGDKFKEELSKANRHAAARERIASSEAGINKRLEGIDGIEGLDRENVVRAFQGESFDKKDLARYNKLMGIKNEPEIQDDGMEEMSTIPSDLDEGPINETNPVKRDKPGVRLLSPPVMPRGSGGPGNGGGFYVGGDLTQNVGKTGDMTTNIGDGSTLIGSSVGNDYSDTIGSNNAGNRSLSLGTRLNSRQQAKSLTGAFGRDLQFS